MKKFYKINKLIFGLSLLCIFIPSLAATSTISHFKLNNAAPYDVAVKGVTHPGNVTIRFSASPPEHRIMRGQPSEVSITTSDDKYSSENVTIIYGVSNRPEWGSCTITFQSAYLERRSSEQGPLLIPAKIVSTQSASTYFRCDFSGDTVTFR